MIEANHPNACNLCHTDRPIDWTLRHLDEWYGKKYSDVALESHYPQRKTPVAIGWLKSDSEAVRLVAADALMRKGDRWAIPELLNALDDPYLLNRQFAQKGLDDMLKIRVEDHGYRFFMTPEERRGPLGKLKAELLPLRQQHKTGD